MSDLHDDTSATSASSRASDFGDSDELRIAGDCLAFGRTAEARTILERVAKSEPTNAEALRLLAQTCLAQNASRAALEAARRATAIDPENDWGWRLESTAASWNGDHMEAKRAAGRALELDPEAWLNFAQIVIVDMGAPRQVTDSTFDAAAEAVRLAPDEVGPYVISGQLARSRGLLDAATTFYTHALSLEPGNLRVKQLLLGVRADRNDAGGATAGYLDLLGENPRSSSIARSLRRTVLRTLEWVNGILLVALIAIGLLAVLTMSGGSDASGGSGRSIGDSLGEVIVVVLMLGGLWLAWTRYRRGLGDRAGEFLSGLPKTSPSLVVLASFQGVGLVALVVLALLIAVPIGGIGIVAGIAGAVAFAMVFLCLIYAGLLRAAF